MFFIVSMEDIVLIVFLNSLEKTIFSRKLIYEIEEQENVFLGLLNFVYNFLIAKLKAFTHKSLLR